MPRVLIVTNHRKNRAPNQRYRFEQYLDFLEQNGFQIDFSNLLNEADDRAFYAPGHYAAKAAVLLKSLSIRLEDVLHANRYDIIFVAREAIMIGTSIIEEAFARSRAKLIFDFDDAIWVNQDSNTSEANRKLAWLKNPGKTRRIIAVADMVFAGNSYLAGYARQFNKNVMIVPTTINTEAYIPDTGERDKGQVIIGWTGSHTTIEHFRMAEPVLKKIKERFGDRVGFMVLGDATYRNTDLDIQGIQWTPENEVPILNKFSIGIMPLPNDEWAKGKCACKGLQYMAVEVPAIMSPVGINADIVQQGENGFLAAKDDEWFDKLCLLIESAELRHKLGVAGRKTVLERYSVLSQRSQYLQHFNSLIKI